MHVETEYVPARVVMIYKLFDIFNDTATFHNENQTKISRLQNWNYTHSGMLNIFLVSALNTGFWMYNDNCMSLTSNKYLLLIL